MGHSRKFWEQPVDLKHVQLGFAKSQGRFLSLRKYQQVLNLNKLTTHCGMCISLRFSMYCFTIVHHILGRNVGTNWEVVDPKQTAPWIQFWASGLTKAWSRECMMENIPGWSTQISKHITNKPYLVDLCFFLFILIFDQHWPTIYALNGWFLTSSNRMSNKRYFEPWRG